VRAKQAERARILESNPGPGRRSEDAAAFGRGKPKISVEKLGKTFSTSEAALDVIRDISFTVGSGEFVSIVGPSGCGKTTLLSIIAGFVKPTHGRVLIEDRRVTRIQADVAAYMFARDNLLPWRRALGNVELAMEMRGQKSNRDHALDLLHRVGLGGFENHYPSELSQGMRQRVALARTLAVDADIWLMDEPFGALDAHTKTLIHDEFGKIWEDTRKTVVLVTHDLAEAILLSDRVFVMGAGTSGWKGIHEIPLSRPRRIMELHSDPTFLDLYRELWEQLRPEMDRQPLSDGRRVSAPS
jgi:NitT/TauT family transport system ATP-binding protein